MANRGKPPTHNIPSKIGEILAAIQNQPIYPSLKPVGYWEQYSKAEQDNIYKDTKNILPSAVWANDPDTGAQYSVEDQKQIIADLSKRWIVGVHETLSLDKVCRMFSDFWQYDDRVEPTKFKYLFLKHKHFGLDNGTKNINDIVLYFVAPFTPYSFNELVAIADEDKMQLLQQGQYSRTPKTLGAYKPVPHQDRNDAHSQYCPVRHQESDQEMSTLTPLTQTHSDDHTKSQTAVNKGTTMLSEDSKLIKMIQDKIFEDGAKTFVNAGISREELSSILQGKEPKISSGVKLSEVLGIPLEKVLELASRTWNNH